MEEKQVMTNEQLESNLKSLRRKARITNALSYCSLFMMVIGWFFMGNILLGLVFLVVTAVFAHISSKNSSALKKILSDNIVSSVLKEALGDNVEYNPYGRLEPGYMVFPFSFDRAGGSDHIKTVYNGLNIELSDIELVEETESTDEDGVTRKEDVTHFKGQWLICDFGKELSGEVHLSANTKSLRRQHKNDRIEMENEAFNNRFIVTANNAQEAYYILTPHMMEYILTMADKNGGEVYMSFQRNGKMQIAVRTDRDFFELGKSKANVDGLRQKFVGELRWFTDMIDTLRVEDTLYKKEANV